MTFMTNILLSIALMLFSMGLIASSIGFVIRGVIFLGRALYDFEHPE